MLTRREMLKYAARVGGCILVPLTGPPFLPRSFADDNPQSPRTTPFKDPLPIPPPPTKAPFSPSAQCMPFVGLETLEENLFFQIVEEERLVQFHSELPPTSIWGYRDLNQPKWPFAFGPTFKTSIDENKAAAVVVRVINQLPGNHIGFGVPNTTVHLHGGHHPSFSDGFPDDLDGTRFVSKPGQSYDHCYPRDPPGFFSDPGQDPAALLSETASTLWYHDHFLDFTGPNVYRGLAGFHLFFENPQSDSAVINAHARDTMDETNAANAPFALRLPSGDFDIPLALQDKIFAPNGALVFDPFEHDGFLGDKFLVNGVIQPFLRVKRRKYRFRFLNASNARFYQIFLTNSDGNPFPMTQIATEGGLLSFPIKRTSFMIAPAERIEVVIDFGDPMFDNPQFNKQPFLFLENRLAQDDGRGPGGDFEQPDLLPAGTRLLKFLLEEKVFDPSRVPDVLRPFAPVSPNELAKARIRTFEFNRSHGAWTINGELVNLNRPMATPMENTPEIWRLINSSGGWWHPIHIHSEFGRVIRRNGQQPFGGSGRDHGQSVEQDGVAKKDMFILGPGSEVDVFLKFRDFAGPFVFHCHNLEHEDMAMMARFDVMPAP